MTGPGAAATTRTSTPKSLSFFSISREVISRVSGATVSCRSKAPSSRLTCGSLESGISVNSGFCRSLATRSLFGISSSAGSMNTGTGRCALISTRSSISISSRSRAAFLPMSRSAAISRLSRREVMKLSRKAPSASATRAHENLKTLETAITPSAMKTKPEPAKPSHLTPGLPTR